MRTKIVVPLVILSVSTDNAAADACRIEHIVSDETFEQIKAAG